MNSILGFNICCIAIVLILLASLANRRQYKERCNRILAKMLVLTLISSLAEIGCNIFENYITPCEEARIIEVFLNYIYFTFHSLIMPLFVLYVYTSADLWHKYKERKSLRALWIFLVGADMSVIALNGWALDMFSVDSSLQYQRGPWLTVVYVVVVILAVWSLSIIFLYRKVIRRDKFITILVMHILVFMAVFLQFIIKGISVENFGISVVLLLYILAVRREENQIDKVSGAIVYNVALQRVTNSFKTDKPLMIILIKIANYSNIVLYLGQEQEREFIRETSLNLTRQAMENQYSADLYYLDYGLFAFFSDDLNIVKARNFSDRISEKLYNENIIGNMTVKVEPRICIIRCPEDISDSATLVTVANSFHETMPNTSKPISYSEYKNNRDYIVKNDMVDIIKRAIENNNVKIYYHPIYSMIEERYVAAEASVRLEDEKYGIINPPMFFSVAERNGFIHKIGDIVLENVMSLISSVDMRKLGIQYIQINMTAAQCIEVDLVEKLGSMMDEKDINPSYICLELSESSADINPTVVDANVRRLHKLGVRFALNDYGTGYSNIKRVVSLPIEQIKLNKSFMEGIDNPRMNIVIRDTIEMLREMGKEVLVEGVGKENTVRRFVELNADLIQGCGFSSGFDFCEPMPKEDFIGFMKKYA